MSRRPFANPASVLTLLFISRSPDSPGVEEAQAAFIHSDTAKMPMWAPHRPVRPPKSLPGRPFKLVSDYDAAGDQPTAIADLAVIMRDAAQ